MIASDQEHGQQCGETEWVCLVLLLVQPLTQEVQGGHPVREGHPEKGGRYQVHLHPTPRPAQPEGMHPTDPRGRMVATHLRAEAAAPARPPAPSAPAEVDVCTQTELPRSEAAVQTSGCWKCPGLFPGAGTGSRTACQSAPSWRTSCSRGPSCRRQGEGCIAARRSMRSWKAGFCTVCREPTAQNQTTQNSLTALTEGRGANIARGWNVATTREEESSPKA